MELKLDQLMSILATWQKSMKSVIAVLGRILVKSIDQFDRIEWRAASKVTVYALWVMFELKVNTTPPVRQRFVE